MLSDILSCAWTYIRAQGQTYMQNYTWTEIYGYGHILYTCMCKLTCSYEHGRTGIQRDMHKVRHACTLTDMHVHVYCI
jgi:hypothetical protein